MSLRTRGAVADRRRYQVLCGLSPALYAPFYVLAIRGFVLRRQWVRPLGLVWAGAILGPR